MAFKIPNTLHSPTPLSPAPCKNILHRNSPNTLRAAGAVVSASSSNGSLNSHGTPGLRVAYQGSAGAYSELAAKAACPGCTPLPARSFADAISSVHSSLADAAIIPVESTMEGTALRNYDLLLRHNLSIACEVSLFVHYCLLAMPGVRSAELRRVISHPLALAHCSRSLARLGLAPEPVEDTAGAVQILRSAQLLDTAAIASPAAASLYGLHVVAHGIQDESWNVTRFLLLSKDPALLHHNKDRRLRRLAVIKKTSMVVAHHGGSMMVLMRVLSAFSSRGINLTRLEVNEERGRPVMILDVRGRQPGQLRSFPRVLYVDFEGSVEDDERARDAVDEISKFSVFARILGCYAADRNVYDLRSLKD